MIDEAMPSSPGANPTPAARAERDIVAVGPTNRVQASARLVERAASDSMSAAKRFLHVAKAHKIDVSNMWASVEDGGAVRQVCLTTPGAGRTAMCFTSTPRSADDEAELALVIGRACAAAPNAAVAQALLEPDEQRALRAFLGAGFLRIADLSYLRRANSPMPKSAPAPPTLPEGVTIERCRKKDDNALIAALERTYIDTLDCPALCRMRDTRDVLESHRATGEFDPDLWWIIRQDDKPEGAMLFNPCPAQQHIELVYMGLSPALRGKGIGRAVLEYGLGVLAHKRREPTITCAVDRANAPALRLYERAGFADFGKRIALVRPLPGGR